MRRKSSSSDLRSIPASAAAQAAAGSSEQTSHLATNKSRFGPFIRAWMPSIILGVAILLIWEIVLWVVDPVAFVLPLPSELVVVFFEDWPLIWAATRVTGYIVVSGLLIGVIAGIAVALMVARYRAAADTLTPLATAISAIPIIALAPLFNNWLGITSARSNQAVVVLMVFFPVFVNTTKGLYEVSADQMDLMQSYAASKWRILRQVRIPNALPYFFSALRIVTPFSVMAAILVEFFGGRQDTLGNFISQNAQFTRYADAWAGVVAGSAVGLFLFFAAVLLERWVTPWAARYQQA